MVVVVRCVGFCFFFQAEDGIRDLVRSRGLGDVYKRQGLLGRVLRRGGVVERASGGLDLHDPGARPGAGVPLSLIHI